MSKVLTDGNAIFTGGMDTSRAPSVIDKHQYVWSVNMEIPKAKEGIRTRRGIKCLRLKFNSSREKEIFETGNVQGIGNYFNVLFNRSIIIVSINGYIIELMEGNDGVYSVKFLNFRNNPNIKKCHINQVPGGVIISDGESAPIFIINNRSGRVRPSNRGIGPNHGGVYVQNRFWYIDQSRKYVLASTIQDPVSMDEAILTNIFGFAIPDESEDFVAIGKQRTISRDVTGGNLSIASTKSNYSADVRGDRADWGGSSGIGKIDNVVNGVGAISPFSYESANSNIYFRNANYGLMSTRSSQYEFVNNDSFSPVSIESSEFFDNDTKEFLEFAYTKFYNTRLYNTVGPVLNESGFVYWSGLLVMSPDIYFATKDRSEINRLESIYTGIRPWCLTVTEDSYGNDNLFIMSHDTDCVNRLYTIDESIDYDIDYNGKRVEIESKLKTRLYDFGSPFTAKKAKAQFFFLDSDRNYDLELFSRQSTKSSFQRQFEQSIKIKSPAGKNLFPFNSDSNIDRKPIMFSDSDEEFHQKQDLFIFKGSINLLRHVRVANELSNDLSANNESVVTLEKSACPNKDSIYSYSINGYECVYPKDDSDQYVKFVEPSFKLQTTKDINRYTFIRKGDKGERGDKGDKGNTGAIGSSNLFLNYISDYVGGESNKIDSIPTTSKTTPFMITVFIGGELQDWILITASGQTEDGPNGIVYPDDSNSITNNKVWIRVR